MDDILDFVVCGRKIGKATGWDQGDTFAMCLHNFKSSKPDILPDSDFVWFLFEDGKIEIYDDDGAPSQSWDMIDTLSQFERAA